MSVQVPIIGMYDVNLLIAAIDRVHVILVVQGRSFLGPEVRNSCDLRVLAVWEIKLIGVPKL